MFYLLAVLLTVFPFASLQAANFSDYSIEVSIGHSELADLVVIDFDNTAVPSSMIFTGQDAGPQNIRLSIPTDLTAISYRIKVGFSQENWPILEYEDKLELKPEGNTLSVDLAPLIGKYNISMQGDEGVAIAESDHIVLNLTCTGTHLIPPIKNSVRLSKMESNVDFQFPVAPEGKAIACEITGGFGVISKRFIRIDRIEFHENRPNVIILVASDGSVSIH